MHELSIVTYVIEQVDKIAKENDIIIKNGQTIFNIFITIMILFATITFYTNIIDRKIFLW